VSVDEFQNRAIAESIREHLMGDQRLAGQCIEVSAMDGYIQIMGCLDTEEQKQLALNLARGMAGVRNVEDRIKVRRPTSPFSECCE